MDDWDNVAMRQLKEKVLTEIDSCFSDRPADGQLVQSDVEERVNAIFEEYGL